MAKKRQQWKWKNNALNAMPGLEQPFAQPKAVVCPAWSNRLPSLKQSFAQLEATVCPA